MVTLQTAPQIKIIQNADQTIVDKIDTTISTTIPVWKSQMVIALGLSNQRKALDLQNKADEVTNKLLARNAAALHKGAVDAECAKSSPTSKTPCSKTPSRCEPFARQHAPVGGVCGNVQPCSRWQRYMSTPTGVRIYAPAGGSWQP